MKLLWLLLLPLLAEARSRIDVNQFQDVLLKPGYPGWKRPVFKFAKQPAQARTLYYRKTPKVEKLRSAIHELYMRPYNYVSYQLGGENPSHYQYHYQTQAPSSYAPKYQPYQPAAPPAQADYRPVVSAPEYRPTSSSTASGYTGPSPPPEYRPVAAVRPAAVGLHPPSQAHKFLTTEPEFGPPEFQPPSFPNFYTSFQSPVSDAQVDHHAVAVLNSGDVKGVVHFYQVGGPTSPVHVTGNITGLTPGNHGFHVHQLGDTSNGCKSMKGHFNPFQVRHGGPKDVYRHVGDLGNIVADAYGVARIDIQDRQITLNGLNNIIGRGLVVHAGQDDLGKGGVQESLKTGNAGGRVACAVIGIADQPV